MDCIGTTEEFCVRHGRLQWEDLWDDAKHRSLKSDLIANLYDNLPPQRSPKLEVEVPA
jgi:hypothetical protein